MFSSNITAEELEKLEYTNFPGEIHVIDSEGDEYNAAVRYLQKQKLIGFDTETKPCFSADQPKNGVALLQLSGCTKAFLFRVNKVDLNKRLRHILSSPKIIKVGAAVHDDIKTLQKRHFFEPAGFIDLQRIVSEWGVNEKSVKKMAAIILGVRVSKTQQLSNWEADVLSEAQMKYAATDAWICREMYLKLQNTAKESDVI